MSDYRVTFKDYTGKKVLEVMLDDVNEEDKNNTGKFFIDNFLEASTTLTLEMVMKLIALSKITDNNILNSFYTNMSGYETVMKIDLNGRLFYDALLMENNLENSDLEKIIKAYYTYPYLTVSLEMVEDY